MHLRTLEIKGFKSFGDKVTIHFDRGVTAIVGPNGSGKSNVVDSVRWVLGEQKTTILRSEKMENVIFNGTKTRKPSNLAEVSLTFDNTRNILPTEYSSVTITRRLFRTGESEYLLNGVQCRLKDITGLFMDTGIGSDSYSIIELKMVDDILNDRNDIVRVLLEEAAGISKYKLRKKQTLQKLEETAADLNRVNDLLFEIEKSMKQLEMQAKKTEKYYRIKEEYKNISISLAIFTLRTFKQKLDELNSNEQTQQDEKIKLTSGIDGIEARIQQLKTESIEKEKVLSTAQKSLNEKLLQIAQFESEEKSKNERLKFLAEKQDHLLQKTNADEHTVEELARQTGELNSQRNAEEFEMNTIVSKYNLLKSELENNKAGFDGLQKELNEINNKVFEARQEINRNETDLAIKESRIKSIQSEITRIKEQDAINAAKEQEIKTELEKIVPQKDRLEDDLEKLRKEKTSSDDELKNTEQNHQSLLLQLAEETRSCDAKTNEFHLMQNMVEAMDGFPESIRFLKKNYFRGEKVPMLSDIMSCREEYKLAVENYLEPFLNYFVVQNAAQAWQAVQTLSDSAKGRANFFVLDSLHGNSHASAKPSDETISALEVVEFDTDYSKLFSFLLGHVFIVPDPKALLEINLESGTAVLLSKNGNFLKQKHTLGGGSVGLFDGKRTGQLKNLEKLGKEISNHEQEIKRIKEGIEHSENRMAELKTAVKDFSQKILDCEAELARSIGSFTSHTSSLEFLSSSKELNAGSITRLETELKGLLEAHERATHETNSDTGVLKNILQELSVHQNAKQNQLAALQEKVTELTQACNDVNIELLQQQNKIQNIIRDIAFKNNMVENTQRSIAENKGELQSVKEQIDLMIAAIKTTNDELVGLIAEKQGMETELSGFESAYYESKGMIDEAEKQAGALRKQREQAEVLIASIHDEVNNLKLQLASMKERMQIEFEIDIKDLLEKDPDESLNEEELAQKSDKLKTQLANFGAINPMALESFREIKERYDFIRKEQDDLLKAKESLLQTISEIDLTAKEKFLDAFTRVREHFINVFRSLFSEEDTCDLILSDTGNPLDADINIIAQPKGKRPLTIHQLSGGEKSLTATALLFGIYLLKPAPFCIFDEVDAPLDDNNIDKFNNIIKKFSSDSQFIIITHNKRTMLATDIMYGITMAEMGVTQVVPVDLRVYA